MTSFSDIYTVTLPIIATQNLIMSITLLMIYGSNWKKNFQYKLGVRLMGIAMFIMAIINYAEYFIPAHFIQSITPTSIVVFAASIELLLMWYTYILLLNPRFITPTRLTYEILLILLFTAPPLFIDAVEQPELYSSLFYLSMAYYIIRYFTNIIIYQKQYKLFKSNLLNFYSDGGTYILSWIQKTFFVVLMIGAISIFVPFTNYCIMFFYQVFLFFAYFYIYYEIIRHESFFKNISHEEPVPEPSAPKHAGTSVTSSEEPVLFSFDKWIAERHYATAGITIEDVASQLKTNRTTLSLYLNSELKMNFYEWISKIRIEHAKKLIEENPQLPIPEIAAHVGIEDRSNFDKMFKRIAGVSPATYRLQFLRNNLK